MGNDGKIIVHCIKKSSSKYVLDELLSMLGICFKFSNEEERSPLTIYYGEIPEDVQQYSIIIPYTVNSDVVGSEIYDDYRKNVYICPPPPHTNFLNEKIPFFYSFFSIKPMIGEPLLYYENGEVAALAQEKKLLLGFDLISSAFYLLSRKEELNGKKDIHGRFSAEDSVAYKKSFLSQPVVNLYLRILFNLISFAFKKQNIPLIQKCYWPNDKKFAVCLTHDVDYIKRPDINFIISNNLKVWSLIKQLKFKQALTHFIRFLKYLKKDKLAYNSFKIISEVEAKYNFRSTFYFAVNKGYKINYRLNREVIKIIKRIIEKGNEVGLHGSYDSYVDEELMLNEKEALEKALGIKVNGVRQHFLRFETPRTWRVQQKAGLKYDTTYGYVSQAGFRASIALPYHPYDLVEKRKLSILELPLTIMDKTIFDRMGLTLSEGWLLVRELLEKIKNCHGLAVLLWHNHVFDDEVYNSGSVYSKIYSKILEYLSKQDAWIAPCIDVVNWWEQRNSFDIKTEIRESMVRWCLEGNCYVKVYLPEGWKIPGHNGSEVLIKVNGSAEVIALRDR